MNDETARKLVAGSGRVYEQAHKDAEKAINADPSRARMGRAFCDIYCHNMAFEGAVRYAWAQGRDSVV